MVIAGPLNIVAVACCTTDAERGALVTLSQGGSQVAAVKEKNSAVDGSTQHQTTLRESTVGVPGASSQSSLPRKRPRSVQGWEESYISPPNRPIPAPTSWDEEPSDFPANATTTAKSQAPIAQQHMSPMVNLPPSHLQSLDLLAGLASMGTATTSPRSMCQAKQISGTESILSAAHRSGGSGSFAATDNTYHGTHIVPLGHLHTRSAIIHIT